MQLIHPCLLYPGLACHGLKGFRNYLMDMKAMRAVTHIMHLYVCHTCVIWGLLVFYF